jgi:hypothetical protein
VSGETVRERNRVNGDPWSGTVQARTADGQNAAQEFNWVAERSACSLPKVFATLRSQLEQDVTTRNSLRPKYAPYEFSIGEDTNAITVRLQSTNCRNRWYLRWAITRLQCVTIMAIACSR